VSQQVVSRPGVVQQTHSSREGESITFHDISSLQDVSSTLLRNAFATSFRDENQTWEHFRDGVQRELTRTGDTQSEEGSLPSCHKGMDNLDLGVFVQQDVLRYIFQKKIFSK
jgi:hypothetical protein